MTYERNTENSVLGPALEMLLKELGYYVNDDGNIAIIIFRLRRIKLENGATIGMI